MWAFVGAAAGVVLGVGFAGARGQHWAVRVICAAGFVAGAVGLLLVALFGGRASPAWDVLAGVVPAFVVASAWAGLPLLMAWVKARPGSAAGAGVVVMALIAGAVGLGPSRDSEGAGPGAGVGVGEQVPQSGRGEPVAVAGPVSQGVAGVGVEEQVPKSGRVAPVAVAGAVSASGENCFCTEGAFCTGPRGGRYCLRPDGSKKYRP